MTQTLTAAYTSTVILGQGSFGTDVQITGSIEVPYYGGDGIFAAPSILNSVVMNDGIITGGANGGSITAATGIYLGGVGTVINAAAANIHGGHGGNYSPGIGITGGTGIDLNSGGIFTNSGVASGGDGGNSVNSDGGEGGAGFINIYGPATVTNNVGGQIYGGTGGEGRGSGGDGGTGVVLDGGGTLINGSAMNLGSGSIVGGAGGIGLTGPNANGGTGVLLDQRSIAANYGTIEGGDAITYNPSHLSYYAMGGTGVLVRGMSSLSNAGTIMGGAGATATEFAGTNGGLGVYLGGNSKLINTGVIFGGAGGTTDNPFYFDSNPNAPGAGGIGLWIDQSTGAVTNTGTIYGGTGGDGYRTGGYGGAGVSLEGGATLTNTGLIQGGAGGSALAIQGTTTVGTGGAGIYLNGGTLINSGTIVGTNGGVHLSGPAGIVGDAVQFGTVASTLVVDPGAQFDGNVAADSAVSDVLELAGTTAGSLAGFGKQFTGFSMLAIDAGANWTVSGSTAMAPLLKALNVNGSLTFASGQFVVTMVEIGVDGMLASGTAAAAQLGSLTLAGGDLACGPQGMIVIGGTDGAAASGVITLVGGTALSGFGTISGQLAGSGTLAVSGGTLVVQSALPTAIAATVAAKATLDLSGGGTLGAITGAGALKLDGAAPFLLAAGQKLVVDHLSIDPHVALSGASVLSGAVANSGILTASGGTLSLHGVTTGNGTFSAAAGSTLDFAGKFTTGGTISGAGTIRFDAASTLNAGAALQAANIIETANIALGKRVSLTNAPGHVFAIEPRSGGAVTLSGAAGDSFTNAGIFTASGSGTVNVNVAFINKNSISAGASHLSFLGGITNDGTISTGSGVLALASTTLGAGTLAIGSGGTLELQNGAAAGQVVQFNGSNGLLDLTHALGFGGIISEFGSNDRIDLLSTASNSFTFTGGTLTVENGTVAVAKLIFGDMYSQQDFAIASDGHGGTVITFT